MYPLSRLVRWMSDDNINSSDPDGVGSTDFRE